MIKKARISIMLIVTVLAMSIGAISFGDEAENTVKLLTIDEAVSLTLKKDLNDKKLQMQLDSLNESHLNAMLASNQIQEILNKIDEFRALHEKLEEEKSLNPADQMTYKIYQAMFGATPPDNTSEEMYYSYIKGRDIPHYALYTSIEQLKNTKALIPENLEKAVRNLLVQTLDVQDGYEVNEALYNWMKQQHEDVTNKYEKGLVSEIDFITSKSGLEIRKLENDKLKRTLETLYNTIKDMTGIDLTQEIELESFKVKLNSYSIKTFDEYLNEANENRAEIKNAQLKYDQVKRENDIIKKYVTSETATDRINAELEETKALNALNSAKLDVEENVYKAYSEIINEKEEFFYSNEKLITGAKSLENTKKTYELGLISATDLIGAEFNYKVIVNNFKKSERDFMNSMKNMELAIGLGPAY